MGSRRPLRADAGVVAGNVYDKYGTGNPIARRLMSGFLDSLDHLVRESGAQRVHEVGCGEGSLCRRLEAQGLEVRGSDLAPTLIAEARRKARREGYRFDLSARDIYRLDSPEDAAELVVCCEVLEHLEEPARAIDSLARIADPWLIASVPREPLWRILNLARGKYWSRAGNTPGHLQHFSSRTFLALLAPRFEVVAVRRPVPWTMALCRVLDGTSSR